MSESKYWEEEWETADREVIEAKQLESLKEITEFAYNNTVYYKRSFDEAGLKPSDIKSLKDSSMGLVLILSILLKIGFND